MTWKAFAHKDVHLPISPAQKKKRNNQRKFKAMRSDLLRYWYYSDGPKLRISPLFPKFLTLHLEYRHIGAFIWKLRISSQALSYILWLRRCSKIRPNFKFSLLCDFFINFPDCPDSARIWFSCCCRTFLSFFPSLFDLSMHDKFWHFVKISINHQTTKTPSKPCFAMF